MAKKKTAKAAAAPKKAPTKSEVFKHLSDKTGVARKDVRAIFDELSVIIGKNLKKSGPGTFTIPGLAKVVAKRVPAKPARKGINPFTKEPTVFKAKPARTVVKIRPLKALKDAV
ncbi:DNA-binding protein [Planctomycetales bacterium ZRK34]|nr:DNA-binding protein [Planctomycetales bacterium ZRK34]